MRRVWNDASFALRICATPRAYCFEIFRWLGGSFDFAQDDTSDITPRRGRSRSGLFVETLSWCEQGFPALHDPVCAPRDAHCHESDRDDNLIKANKPISSTKILRSKIFAETFQSCAESRSANSLRALSGSDLSNSRHFFLL